MSTRAVGTGNLWGAIVAFKKEAPPVIFRDLKPSNIMVTPKGKIKLIDFGIARHFKAGSSVDTSAYGSAGYAPPEQYGENQTDARSDIYALGAVLHFLLTGKDPSKNPFTFEPPGEILPASVSPALEAAIMKALSLKSGDRPGSAGEMLGLLKADGSDIPGRTETIAITAPVTEKEPEEVRSTPQETEKVLTETIKVQQNTETIGILGLEKPRASEIKLEATIGKDTLSEAAAGCMVRASSSQESSKDSLPRTSGSNAVQTQKISRSGSMKWISAAVGIVILLILGQQLFNQSKSNDKEKTDKTYQISEVIDPAQNQNETQKQQETK